MMRMALRVPSVVSQFDEAMDLSSKRLAVSRKFHMYRYPENHRN